MSPNEREQQGQNRKNRQGRRPASRPTTEPVPLKLLVLEDRLTPNTGVQPPPGGLSGFVYVDSNDNGVKEAGEAPISGVSVSLVRIVAGVTTAVATTVTASDGAYSFINLPAGTGYRVIETQPAAYADGQEQIGSTGGNKAVNDQLDGIVVPSSAVSVNNNFGELPGGLSGFVYVDANDNGIKDPGEAPIPGATVTLQRVQGGVTTAVATTVTAADGSYSFNLLLMGGGYQVVETQPAGFDDGKDTPGAVGGGVAAVNDQIQTISLSNAARFSPDNNFGELNVPVVLPKGTLSGFVYEDPNDNGIKEGGEAPIPGTTVTLVRVLAGVTTTIGSTLTAADGSYSFTNLTPGLGYRVIETQPAGFLDGKDTPGTTTGTVSVNDQIDGITVPANGTSANNNFGELRPAQLSGFVYVDANDNGIKEAGEAPIPGTVVTLTGTDDLGAVSRVATTAADGSYNFTGLRPGSYNVRETQPAGFNDGKDTIGTINGLVSTGVTTNDNFAGIVLAGGQSSPNNNFGELVPVVPPPPAGSLSGFVYEDPNNNGVKEAGEAPLGGVAVVLYKPGAAQGTVEAVSTTTTAADGSYSFTNLAPGYYWVREPQQPAGFLDGKEAVGSAGGQLQVNDWISNIPVVAGQNSPDNNFGELRPSSLSGFVYEDANDNGVKEAGEAGLGGVAVVLLRPGAAQSTVEAVATTTTAADGSYSFINLAPGYYWVREAVQPAGFLDGKDTPGSTGGQLQVNDWLSNIPLGYNAASVNNNFGEILQKTTETPPKPNPQNPNPNVSKLNFLGSS